MTTPFIINLGLSLNGDYHSILVSNRVLRWLDMFAPYNTSNITYTLTAVPIFGKLQIKTDKIWTDLAATDTFTQDDINNYHIRYVSDETTPTTTGFIITATNGTTTTPPLRVNITVQTKALVITPAQDNVIDLSTQTTPKKIETEAGKDIIKPGLGNDCINPGRDDDKVDLSIGGADEVHYEYQKTEIGYIALDGGDDITDFKRGDDKLVFGSAKDDDFINYVNIKYEVMVDVAQNEANIWQVTGLYFIFADAVFTNNGALASGILSLTFATPLELDDFQTLVSDNTPFDGFDNLTGLITTPEALAAVLGHDSIGTETTGTSLADVTIDIHENHPLTKAVFDTDPPAGVIGGIFSLAEGEEDNDLFTIDSYGKLWWRDLVDYETSRAAFGGNVYRVKVTHTVIGETVIDETEADNTATQNIVTTTRLDIKVQNILLEKDGTSTQTRRETGVATVNTHETLIPDEDQPTGLVRYLMGSSVFASPTTGPLTLTWSFDNNNERSMLQTQADFDAARVMMERAFAEFENAANLKFIEVGRNGEDIRGDMSINLFTIESGDSLSPTFPGETNIVNIGGVSLAELHYANVVRKLGHALGLSHPFQSEGGWGGDESYRHSLDTVMSLRHGKYDDGLEPADIQAMQYLYGPPGSYYQSIERFFDISPSSRDPQLINWQRSSVPEDTDTDTVIHTVTESIVRFFSISPVVFNLDPTQRDNRFFTIDKDDGEIRLKNMLDFENPIDGEFGDVRYAKNNTYELKVDLETTLDYPAHIAPLLNKEPGIQIERDIKYIAITLTDIDETLPSEPPPGAPEII